MANTQTEHQSTAWADYKASRSVVARNRVVELYRHLATEHAAFVRRRLSLPASVDEADLVSAGTIGLIAAVEGFDSSRDVSFGAYSCRRIRGAILDELRSWDWLPRAVRDVVSAMRRTEVGLRSELGRKPTLCELAGRLGTSVADAAAVERIGLTESRSPAITEAYVDTTDQADRRLDAGTLLATRLNAAERLLVALHYFDGVQWRHIGQMLGIDSNRLSHLHASILEKLRKSSIFCTRWHAAKLTGATG